MAKKKPALPKRILVTRETDQNDPNESYLTAHEESDTIDDGDTVGVYELVETKIMRVTRDLK